MDSKYFTLEDLACHSGVPTPAELVPRLEALMAMLDVIREAWQGPLIVVSGYRSPEFNQALADASAKRNGGVSGVAKDSQHIQGRAADVRPTHPTPERVARLYELVWKMVQDDQLPPLGGLGDYRGWIHVDTRPRKNGWQVTRWTGQGIGEST